MQALKVGITLLALALSAGSVSVAALAQEPDSQSDSIVTANRADVLIARVSYREINLSTDQGVALLRSKVKSVAGDLCTDKDAIYVYSSSGYMNCYRSAMTSAEPQIALAAKRFGNPAYAAAANRSIVIAIRR